MTALQHLYLNGNLLTGSIPPELGNLAALQRLLLYDNQLSGVIPPELGSLSALLYTYLDGNALVGPVPVELMDLVGLLDNKSDFCNNHLYSNDPGLSSFLDTKQIGGDWASCQVIPEPTCGDRIIGGGEECDDGDTTPGDGCDGSCQIETGWTCAGEPSVCTKQLPTLSPWSQLALIAGLLGAGLGVWRGRGTSSGAA
jgi:cysteine-rich repeat protein